MWRYHPELLATPVPRYTSYPTAAEFHDGLGASEMAAALAAVPPDACVSLYVHIPFCERICWYCGCNTGAANRTVRVSAYLDALHAEIGLVSAQMGGRPQIRRIAFGGGSPNALDPADFLALAEKLKRIFHADGADIAIEIDPRSFTPEWADLIGALGATRVSLGVQTFTPHVQQAIGRIQPEEMIQDTVERLRAAGVASINFDLMYGLPGQTRNDLSEGLTTALGMRPERIALFGYAHVPHLIPRQRQIAATGLPDADERFRQAAMGHEMLTQAGYGPVGFDHFAVPGDPLASAARSCTLRRNFQGFTDDDAGILIGLGASAISQFSDLLLQNEKNAGRYRMLVQAGRLPQNRGVALSPKDRLRGRIIEDILCRGEADIRTLPDPEDAIIRLRPFEAQGLLKRTDGKLILAQAALPYARAIAACFDTYRQQTGQRFSNAI